MTRDTRLHADPSLATHNARIEAARKELDDSVGEGWSLIVQPLARLAKACAVGELPQLPSFPSDGDRRCEQAFRVLAAEMVEGQCDDAADAPAYKTLALRVAANAGPEMPPDATAISGGARLFHDWDARCCFVAAVPQVAIDSVTLDLIVPPPDDDDWVDRIAGRDKDRNEIVRHLELSRSRREVVPWLREVERFARNAVVGETLLNRSALLERAGARAWSTWLANLPHPYYSALVAAGVDDPDFLQAAIDAAPLAWASREQRFVALVQLVWRAIELLQRLDDSLRWQASMRWSGSASADATQYTAALQVWRSNELPTRIRGLAASLVGVEETRTGAVGILRELECSTREDSLNIRALVREQLTTDLAASAADATFTALLVEPVRRSGLIAAGMLRRAAPGPGRAGAIVKAYRRWIDSEDFFWAAPLKDDDAELVEAVARAIAVAPTAHAHAEWLLQEVILPAEGWCFEFSRWLKNLPQAAHVLMSIAISSCVDPAAEGAEQLSALAWDCLTVWARSAHHSYADDRVVTATAYVWKCAGRVRSVGPRAAARLAEIDDVWHLLVAAENYAGGLGEEMPVECQRAVRDAFELHRPLLDADRHLSVERRTAADELVRCLARAVYVESDAPGTP